MTVVVATVLLLFAHGVSSSVHALVLERPSFGNYGGSNTTSPGAGPGAGIRREPTVRLSQSTAARQDARVRTAQKMKERALSMLQKFGERLDRYEEFIGKVSSRKPYAPPCEGSTPA